jgi:hypothetical protein
MELTASEVESLLEFALRSKGMIRAEGKVKSYVWDVNQDCVLGATVEVEITLDTTGQPPEIKNVKI